jgi:hypothetical protein
MKKILFALALLSVSVVAKAVEHPVTLVCNFCEHAQQAAVEGAATIYQYHPYIWWDPTFDEMTVINQTTGMVVYGELAPAFVNNQPPLLNIYYIKVNYFEVG